MNREPRDLCDLFEGPIVQLLEESDPSKLDRRRGDALHEIARLPLESLRDLDSSTVAAALLDALRLGGLESDARIVADPQLHSRLVEVRRLLSERANRASDKAGTGCLLAGGSQWYSLHVAWTRSETLPDGPTVVLFDYGRQRADEVAGEIRRIAVSHATGPQEMFVLRTRLGPGFRSLPSGWEMGLSAALRLARDMGSRPLPRWAIVGTGDTSPPLEALPPDVRVFVLERDGDWPQDLADWADDIAGPDSQLAPFVDRRSRVCVVASSASQVAACLARIAPDDEAAVPARPAGRAAAGGDAVTTASVLMARERG